MLNGRPEPVLSLEGPWAPPLIILSFLYWLFWKEGWREGGRIIGLTLRPRAEPVLEPVVWFYGV